MLHRKGKIPYRMPKCQYRVSTFWLHSCRPYWRALIVWFTGSFQFSSCLTSVLYTWHHLIETLFSLVFAKAILSWFSFCFVPRMRVMISMSLVLVLIIFITRRTFITISLTAYCICKTGLFQSFCLTFSKPASVSLFIQFCILFLLILPSMYFPV